MEETLSEIREKLWHGRKRDLKQRYLKMFSVLIDRAFEGKPQPFMFCKDENGEPIILELYMEYETLHWRVYGGTDSRSIEQDGSD